jgi:prolyl-tRNA editing enzyme YbaK/EbsC (Cys-tRNA(Pro) deacylase)
MLDGPQSASARRVQDVLDGFAPGLRVVEFEQTTRTSAEAAAAIGCTVAQIAKSLIFRTKPGDRPVLVVASGVNRVDEKAVPARFTAVLDGAKLARADADFVRARTGFAIGGVPPVGHAEPPVVLIDRDLLNFDVIWAAAGTPNAVFQLTPAQLVAITGGTVGEVA